MYLFRDASPSLRNITSPLLKYMRQSWWTSTRLDCFILSLTFMLNINYNFLVRLQCGKSVFVPFALRPISIPGCCSLWTGSRLLQRRRINQVGTLNGIIFLWRWYIFILELWSYDAECFMIYSFCEFGLRSFLIFFLSSANKCLLKVATYAAQLEQYPKAIEIYEQVW